MHSDLAPAMAAALIIPALLVFAVLWIALAIGNGYLASRLSKNIVLWVILTLIPGVNYFFFIYVGYSVALGLLDRLNAITAQLRIPPGAR